MWSKIPFVLLIVWYCICEKSYPCFKRATTPYLRMFYLRSAAYLGTCMCKGSTSCGLDAAETRQTHMMLGGQGREVSTHTRSDERLFPLLLLHLNDLRTLKIFVRNECNGQRVDCCRTLDKARSL